MKQKFRILSAFFMMLFLVVLSHNAVDCVQAAEVNEGWDETHSVYYVKENDKLVKADGVVKVEAEYLYFVNGVFQDTYTGLKKIKDEDTFEVYYIESGKAVLNTWKTVKEKKGNFKYYFGKNGKAYKAGSISGMRTTKVKIKAVNGTQYGFDENGHCVKGLWSTDKKLVYFNKKTGVYDKKKSKVYQKAVKTGKKSVNMPKNLKKTFGKPKKIKTVSSCNPFDIKQGTYITNSTLKRYKGYNYIYQNIVISVTKNKNTGVYHMDGAGPIDLN